MNLLLILLVICFSQLVFAAPAQVVIIRHGEKIDDVNPNLSPRGFERAKALVGFFSSNSEVAKFGSPKAIYAAKPKVGGSLRPLQTVTPLAESVGQTVLAVYSKNQIQQLAYEILNDKNYDGQSVVISWVHDGIPALASQLGCSNCPAEWNSTVFDRVWIIRFKDNAVESFEDVPQHLLPGDSAK